MIELTRLAARFQALSDPSRLRLLQFIDGREPTATECVLQLGQSQPRVARHLKILVEAGILAARREGRFVHYALAEQGAGAILARAALAASPVSLPASAPSDAPAPAALRPPAGGGRADPDPPAGGKAGSQVAEAPVEEISRPPLEDFLL